MPQGTTKITKKDMKGTKKNCFFKKDLRVLRSFLGVLGGSTVAPFVLAACTKPAVPPPPPDVAVEVVELSAAEASSRMNAGTLTSHALTNAYLQRIAALDKAGPTVNSIIQINPDALKDADALDAERRAGKVRGPLHGIPIVIKDNIDVAGLVNSAGSLALADRVPQKDAPLVQHLRDALGDGSALGVAIAYSHEQEALETAGGIAWALPLLDEKPFLVVNSDVYSDVDFAPLAMRARALSVQQPAHLVLVNNPEHHPLGDFGLQGGRVTTEPPKLTFSGVGAYHPSLFANIPRGAKARLAAQLAGPIAAGQVSGEHHLGEWNDVGTPERLAELDARLHVTR